MSIYTLLSHFREHVLQYLAKGGFLKAVAKLSGATAIGQIVSLLASLFLTRLYTPEDFGSLAIFVALLTQLTVFTSLRYEWAIPPAQDDDEAFHLVLLCALIVVLVTLLTAIGVFFWAEQIARWLNAPRMAEYLYLLPIGVLFIGWYQIFNYWALRRKEFSMLAKSQVAKSVWTSATQVVLGFLLSGPIGLLIGAVVNQIAGTHSLLLYFWQDYQRPKVMKFSLNRLRQTARKHFRFAGICIFSSFFNYAAIAFPPLLLSLFYTPDVVGSFSLAQRVSSLPTVLVCSAISQVYFANACDLIHTNPIEMKRLHTRTTLLLFGISLGAGGVFLLSRWIMPFAFGSQWQEAGIMTQYMAPMLIVTIAVSPLTMLEWLGKNQEILVWHSIRLALITVGFVVAHQNHWSASIAIAIFSMITGLMYIVLFGLNRYAINSVIKGKVKLSQNSIGL
jgi:O-antigen/teichoic acid export membrane protein